MNPLSDKDLDRLSREAAEQYDVNQNTSGWEKLEQKLNQYLPETGRKERRRFLFFIWLLVLLSGGGLVWMLTGKNAPELAASKQISPDTELPFSKNTEAGKLTSDDKTGNNTNDKPEQNRKASAPSISKNKAITSEKSKEVELEKIISQNNTTLAIGKSRSHKKNTTDDLLAVNNSTTNSKGRKSISSADALNKKDNQNTTSSIENKPNEDISSPTEDIPAAVAQNETKLSSNTDKQPVAEQIKTDSVSNLIPGESRLPKSKGDFRKGFEIGLVAGPDMSNVNFSSIDKVSFIAGVQLGYRFSQRWSVNTGVLYTKKNYSSPGKDFHPPKGSWLDNVTLNKVDGNCFMYDIPLNVRYDLDKNTNHRFFVSTGLSTYLMKKEDYHYYYKYANGSPGYRARSYPSIEQHWFSVLNMSAGFEKKLSRRFSLQTEPYLKIPLQGVGYGNLQLNSYGIYFSLKYHTKGH